MAYMIEKGTVSSYRIKELCEERPVDGEFVLPEYCPDIATVLKCFMVPMITSRRNGSDAVTLEGNVQLRVLYLSDDRKQLHTNEMSVPFVSTIPINGDLCLFGVEFRPQYLNCHASGPRRIEIHGAFKVCLRCREAEKTEVIVSAEGKGMYADTATVPFSAPYGCYEKSFSVNEIVGTGNDAVKDLLFTQVTAIPGECRPMRGKAIIKGELAVYFVYTDGDGSIKQNEQSIPFSQIVDAEGVDEKTADEIAVSVDAADIRTAVDPNGENTLLSVNCKLTANLVGCRNEAAEILRDAFCTLHPVQMETRGITLRHIGQMRREALPVRDTVELPTDDLTEIVCLWCRLTHLEGQGNCLEGSIQLSMITRNEAGTLAFYERPIAFSQEMGDSGSEIIADGAVRRVEYAVIGRKLELRIEVVCCCHVTECVEVTAVTALAVDEQTKLTDDFTGVKVYYAEEGETVWEIAKHCRTSRQLIMEENGLPDDRIAEPKMLLIPVK